MTIMMAEEAVVLVKYKPKIEPHFSELRENCPGPKSFPRHSFKVLNPVVLILAL